MTAGATRGRTQSHGPSRAARRDGVDADSGHSEVGDVPDDVVEEADDHTLFGVDTKNNASGDHVEGLSEIDVMSESSGSINVRLLVIWMTCLRAESTRNFIF